MWRKGRAHRWTRWNSNGAHGETGKCGKAACGAEKNLKTMTVTGDPAASIDEIDEFAAGHAQPLAQQLSQFEQQFCGKAGNFFH